MSSGRREILIGAAAILAVGGMGQTAHPILFLHSDGFGGHDLATLIRLGAEPHRLTRRQVRVLSHGDFTGTDAMLKRASGSRIAALLNDADALIIETLLSRHGARGVATRRTGGGAVLLTAIL